MWDLELFSWRHIGDQLLQLVDLIERRFLLPADALSQGGFASVATALHLPERG